MRDVDEYRRYNPKLLITMILLVSTLIGIVCYLIFTTPEKKVVPSEEAIARLNQVSADFKEVLKKTELEYKLEVIQATNRKTQEDIKTLFESYCSVSEENERLKKRNEELESAVLEATEWMDRMMEMLDGR